jgi:uncharacterized protein (TIGR01777 family)
MKSTTDTVHFHHRSVYPCKAADLYGWHERPGALERLLPPWEKTTVLQRRGGLEPGGEVLLKMHIGPLPFHFRARHTTSIPGRMFQDIQEEGPFACWSHSHFFEDGSEGAILRDEVTYALPGQRLLPDWIKRYAAQGLERLFHHRESVLREDILLHKRCSTTPMRVLVTGASGIVGRDLLPLLTTGGHRVYTLVRRRPDPDKGEIYWDPANNILNKGDLPELDGVIHLAGKYLGLSRWSEEKKRKVIDSRVHGTELLARTLAGLGRPPKVLLSASAVGFYGDCADAPVDETAPSGRDFISEVCRRWEQAAQPARDAGIRTVFMRLGIGLTPRGGALQRILASSPFGCIRRFGTGRQYISWISGDDMISAILHTLACPELEGPVNIAAPLPVTNTEFMATIARIAGKRLLFPLPAALLRNIYGQMASEILLSGCRASTGKLQNSGFVFRHPTLEEALRSMLGRIEQGRSHHNGSTA